MKREMIKEEYCTFETCKLLKEAGFPQEGGYDCFFDNGERYSVPKQAQAMRWLREKHNILIEPSIYVGGDWVALAWLWNNDEIRQIYEITETHSTYEAAAEAGIQAACRYIIEKGGGK